MQLSILFPRSLIFFQSPSSLPLYILTFLLLGEAFLWNNHSNKILGVFKKLFFYKSKISSERLSYK